MNQSQKTKLTIFVIISILVIALSGLIGFDLADIKQSKQVDNSVDISKKWQECLDHYQKEELKSAESCVTPFVLQFADLEQGCELMVSIYAESMNYVELEKISELCISKNKTNDTVVEGLSFAHSVQGRADVAIEKLINISKKTKSPRLYISLSRLHLMIGKDKEAKKYYLEALKLAEVWTMWVTYGLKIPSFRSDRDFIKEVGDIVLSKTERNQQVESQLIKIATTLNVQELIERLSQNTELKK